MITPKTYPDNISISFSKYDGTIYWIPYYLYKLLNTVNTEYILDQSSKQRIGKNEKFALHFPPNQTHLITKYQPNPSIPPFLWWWCGTLFSQWVKGQMHSCSLCTTQHTWFFPIIQSPVIKHTKITTKLSLVIKYFYPATTPACLNSQRTL